MRDIVVLIGSALMAAALFAFPWLRPLPQTTHEALASDLRAGAVSCVTIGADGMARVDYKDGEKAQLPAYESQQWRDDLVSQGALVRQGASLSLSSASGMALLTLAALRFTGRIGRKDESVGTVNGSDASVPGLTLNDVAGNPEAREAMAELCDFLRRPAVYAQTGARPPSGVLLWGPPGTGKTLLARALAGEAGVPFFAATGSDFVQMYAGVGASRVRELFRKARAAVHCVVFIDEIDALGRRGADNSGGERDQTLNALLSELSGFVQRPGVMVLAATNRPEMLDEALTRPGRFDRMIHVGLPDAEAREAILRLHSRKKPLESVDLARWAGRTIGFSGAQLERLLNEAAIAAARREAQAIHDGDLEAALLHVITGTRAAAAAVPASNPGNESAFSQDGLRIAAMHEAGHALLTRLRLPGSAIERVSVLRSSAGCGGFCLSTPDETPFHRRSDLQARLLVMLGGRAAEAVAFGAEQVSTGASDDLRKATQLAWDMVTRFGMDESFGPVSLDALAQSAAQAGSGAPGHASRLAHEACSRLLLESLRQAEGLLEQNRAVLYTLAQALQERLTLDGKAVGELLADCA